MNIPRSFEQPSGDHQTEQEDEVVGISNEGINQSEKIDRIQIKEYTPQEIAEIIESIRDLPPDAVVEIFHGAGRKGADQIIEMLNGWRPEEDQSRFNAYSGLELGVKETNSSGRILSVYPLAPFWENAVGIRYLIPRKEIKFSDSVANSPEEHLSIDNNGFVSIVDWEFDDKFLSFLDQNAEIIADEATIIPDETERRLLKRNNWYAEARNNLLPHKKIIEENFNKIRQLMKNNFDQLLGDDEKLWPITNMSVNYQNIISGKLENNVRYLQEKISSLPQITSYSEQISEINEYINASLESLLSYYDAYKRVYDDRI